MGSARKKKWEVPEVGSVRKIKVGSVRKIKSGKCLLWEVTVGSGVHPCLVGISNLYCFPAMNNAKISRGCSGNIMYLIKTKSCSRQTESYVRRVYILYVIHSMYNSYILLYQ